MRGELADIDHVVSSQRMTPRVREMGGGEYRVVEEWVEFLIVEASLTGSLR